MKKRPSVVNTAQNGFVYPGDILFSWSGALEVQLWSGVKGVLNQHIFKIIPKSGYGKYYEYIKLREYAYNLRRIAESQKTTIGSITRDYLKQEQIIVPPEDIITRFEIKIRPFYQMLLKNKQEILQLKKTVSLVISPVNERAN